MYLTIIRRLHAIHYSVSGDAHSCRNDYDWNCIEMREAVWCILKTSMHDPHTTTLGIPYAVCSSKIQRTGRICTSISRLLNQIGYAYPDSISFGGRQSGVSLAWVLICLPNVQLWLTCHSRDNDDSVSARRWRKAGATENSPYLKEAELLVVKRVRSFDPQTLREPLLKRKNGKGKGKIKNKKKGGKKHRTMGKKTTTTDTRTLMPPPPTPRIFGRG